VVAVLDANVLIPPGLRDMLLSCAHVGVFRPVWQDEILDEVHRNSTRMLVSKEGMTKEQATAAVEHALNQMRRAFPDACAETKRWVPLVPKMTCDEKDRHVLAVAVGTDATHLVTTNLRDFPVHSRPSGIAVVSADRFLRDRLGHDPQLVVEAVVGMSRRLRDPSQSPAEIAALFAEGRNAPRFGLELAEVLAARDSDGHHGASIRRYGREGT
jgi:predicted nucleic acid-binding protein